MIHCAALPLGDTGSHDQHQCCQMVGLPFMHVPSPKTVHQTAHYKLDTMSHTSDHLHICDMVSKLNVSIHLLHILQSPMICANQIRQHDSLNGVVPSPNSTSREHSKVQNRQITISYRKLTNAHCISESASVHPGMFSGRSR